MDDSTLLHRQIHPSYVQNDVVSSQAFSSDTIISSESFNPSEKDNDQLSVYNGEKYTSEESFIHYNSHYESYGVLSVLHKECIEIEPLSVFENNFPFDGHTCIDFTNVESKNQKKKKAAKLRDCAIKRSWTHKA